MINIKKDKEYCSFNNNDTLDKNTMIKEITLEIT